MSIIDYYCPCGKSYRINKRFAGRSSRCICCRREYTVPESSSIILPVDPDDPSSSSASSALRDSELDESLLNAFFLDEAAKVDVMGAGRDRLKKPRWGKYEIHAKLSGGGMGAIFIGRDTVLDREVAIKRIQDRYKNNPSIRKRFLREARISGKLAHQGIIPVYSLDFDENDEPFYAMQLMYGQTLLELIAQYHRSHRSSLPKLQELVRYFVDACRTITYAHANHVVHRDIKPANIMRSGFGETFVLDWGLAKKFKYESGDADAEDEPTPGTAPPPEDDDDDDERQNLTMVEGRIGTLGYQSPEYLTRGVSQPSDDIFALGVTLYYLLTGKIPFLDLKGGKKPDYMSRFEMLMSKPEAPHTLNSMVDKRLSAICLHAVAFKPEDRFRSAKNLADAVEEWLGGASVSKNPLGRTGTLRNGKLLGGVASSAALVGLVLGFLLSRFFR